MRPPKPKIAKPRLLWRWKRNAWIPVYRVTWTEGGRQRARQVFLNWGGDPQELDRLYWLAHTGKHSAQQTPAQYTWRDCVIAWRRDAIKGQGKLAASSRASYRRTMDAILEKNASKDMRRTTRQAVRTALETMSGTPRKASRYAQTISLLWNYAERELDWPMGPNPAKGLAAYKPAREMAPWPEWMLEKLTMAPENVRIAATLIRYTGQRPSAAIAMRHDQISGEWMTVRDEKGGKEFDVYCPARLREHLPTWPRRGEHILAKNSCEPVGYGGVEKAFRKWRETLGERASPFTLHGLRKLAVVELAEAGCGDAEIQAVTGQSAEIVAYYRKMANRKRLSRSAQSRLD